MKKIVPFKKELIFKDNIAEISARRIYGKIIFYTLSSVYYVGRIVKEEKLNTDVIIAEIAQKYDLKHIFTFERNISNKTPNLPTERIRKKSKVQSQQKKGKNKCRY